jgi:hypothetical protein
VAAGVAGAEPAAAPVKAAPVYTEHMRRMAVVLVAIPLLAACAERRPLGSGSGTVETPKPQVESPKEESGELPGATCKTVNEGEPANLPDFVAVDVASEGGVDRISFEFEPAAGAPNEPPWHFIDFTDELVTEGEGKPVKVEGEAFVIVSFQAIGTDLSGEMPVRVYTGKERFTPGFPTLREAAMLGDFEAQVSWGLGLSRKACYRVDAGKDHITLEFPSA